MTCVEAKEYLFAFLDSELDASLSIELQRHLDHCPVCAREAEIEREVRRALRGMFESGPAPAFNVNAWSADFATKRRIAVPTRRPWRARIATVSGVAVVLCAYGVWRGLYAVDGPGLIDMIVADHTRFVAGDKSLHIESGNAFAVSDWLSDRTSVPVVLPISRDAKCRLLGGRQCRIGGRQAAFAAYRMNGSPASLLVVRGTARALRDMRLVEHDDSRHWVDHRDGYTVVACQRGTLVYAAVSQIPEKELLCLMTGSQHEGD